MWVCLCVFVCSVHVGGCWLFLVVEIVMTVLVMVILVMLVMMPLWYLYICYPLYIVSSPQNFGLDVDNFRPLAKDCPSTFLDLAVQCCDLDSDKRPSFQVAMEGLDYLLQLPDSTLMTSVSPFYQLPGIHHNQRFEPAIKCPALFSNEIGN